MASQLYDSRIMLKLPIWIVTEHIQPTDAEYSPEAEPGTALAFSSSSKLFKFMAQILVANGRCKWPLIGMDWSFSLQICTVSTFRRSALTPRMMRLAASR